MELVKVKRIKRLGQGSYGLVDLAHVRRVNASKLLAVKSAYKYASLQKEERIYLTLADCPQVVRCYGRKLSIEKHRYVVFNLLLEYAPRGTLSDFIQNCGSKLEESQVQDFTRMLLQGLHFIHLRGYVHCDLKPANILVFPSKDTDGFEQKYDLKMADFGLAKEPYIHQFEDSMGCGVFRGASEYMSPESYSIGQIEPALDIWSLGCVVSEMVTGKRVWSGQDMNQVMDYLTNWLEIKESHQMFPDNISDKGIDFLKRCFEIDPADRWTASMLLDHPFVAAEKE